ncbi:MAG: acetyl-CoA carboxylase biotin carboxylase subunit [Alphaproteobacteria bacterium]|jgi:acetyl-CoA carboxylase biotin carboxylase subunit|uniref:acetyl-CoA carboxylase biotin carboxylase subunit n=1 Tax=Pacificispira sp. TaxID=2888761 RepID=UPI001B220A2F|nr:acetyl-CoA carboxylase biotin carboxylase subunit [Alphaproteobacteria bacterium]
MFEKVLIANRGEIALRIHRACKEMGIQTVAIHSTADADAMHVRLADEAICIGPPAPKDSYLNIPAILTAATLTRADAIHPGVGFLSENARFAEMVEDHGITFIGPTPAHMRVMGDKVAAKDEAKRLGIPVVPGSDGSVDTEAEALKLAEEIGFPLIIKAAAGGGGRGMKVANKLADVAQAWAICRTEAKAAFGDDTVYMERYLSRPRHIEVQVLGDGQGNCVNLGERDCSIQRRHQKVIEEAPSPALNASQRKSIGDTVNKAIGEMGYRGAGTIEFLYEDGEFFFIEMNTRLQVEHPISEMVCGIDLVREQIKVAAGMPLAFKQSDIEISGHAIECRVTAEHPETFMPTPGKITDYHAPGGLGVRVDSQLYSGYRVPPYYDSLVSKLVVHGANRNECLMRLRRALDEYVIGGIQTTIPLHQKIIAERPFIDGDYDIHWLEKWMGLK